MASAAKDEAEASLFEGVSEGGSEESYSLGGSEEEETDEEDEDTAAAAPRAILIKPTFIPRSQRARQQADADHDPGPDGEADEADTEMRRRAGLDEMVEAQIKKDLEVRASGRKQWDDLSVSGQSVDTTDDLDPAAEEAAWRLRELKRIQRGREAIEVREREIAELERRRGLTAEERQAEDAAHLERQRDAQQGRGRMAYMQKYYHSGAFYRDSPAAADLLSRDIMGSTIADDVRDRAALPEYLQRRDMTRLGRKGATKYKDLRSEDTGRWGESDPATRRGPQRGQPEDPRFLPDADGGYARTGGSTARDANATPLGKPRTQRPPMVGRPVLAVRGDKDRYRDRAATPPPVDNQDRQERGRDDQEQGRGAVSSRSPLRENDDLRRKRSSSPSARADSGDKRRRIDKAR